ncbi:MAG: type I-C CRISPR-associated protein Cas5c [Sphaerochaeta sp.]|jgi:CRISPR-associated protein Cas5d
MKHHWVLEIWGDYACFTRPEMKVERVSYDIITPSAARGIFEAILWKPAIRWHILKIDVLKPIKKISVRRNELDRLVSAPTQMHLNNERFDSLGIYIEDTKRQQRASLILKDVAYRIYAWFELLPEKSDSNNIEEDSAKYAAMFARRASQGQCFHRPYLGCREFSCHFRLVHSDEDLSPPINESKEFGWMLYDLDYSNLDNIQPEFFFATMNQGSIITDRKIVEVIQ